MASIQKTFSIIRAANTTDYSAGDVINASGSLVPIVIDLTDLQNKQAWLMGNQLISSNEAGTPTISLHIFSDTFAIAADNAPFAPTDAQLKLLIATITHDPANSTWKSFTTNKKISAKTDYPESINMSKIYGVYTADTAMTPISGEEITSKLSIYQE